MTDTTQLARSIAFTSPFHYPDILCQLNKLASYRIPKDKREAVLRQAMRMAGASNYTLAEATDKILAPFLKRKRRHTPTVESLRAENFK